MQYFRELERTKDHREQLLEQLEEAKQLRKFTTRRRDKLSQLLEPHLPDLFQEKFIDFSTRLVDIVLGEEQIKERIKLLDRQKKALDTMYNNILVSVL